MGQETLLHLLYEKEGQYISGEEMSQVLGVSRSAVWKQISALRQQGYKIDSVQNKGYCLQKSPLLLEKEKISLMLTESDLGRELHCFETIDSTNTEVKRRALEGAEHGLVVVSQEQTAGRGRRGRNFHSPAKGLYLSLLLRPHQTYDVMADLTAWVAVAVCRGIHAYCGILPQIKWTNDIVLGEKKLCGILTELTLETESDFVQYVVVGIGINAKEKKEDFPSELQNIAISLEEVLGKSVDLNSLCASVLLALNEMYVGFPQQKQVYLKEYTENCVTVNREIQVLRGDNRREAKAVGIDEEFRLLVEYPSGEREALSTGEVSVRGMYGYV